ISKIERAFHESISKKNINQLVNLFAPHATGTFGPGKTVTGKQQIRQFWLKSGAFKPTTHWLSDHPAYKLKVTADGDRGTLHFECHFIDIKTGKVAQVTAGNLDVARIDGRWRITNFVGSTSALTIGAPAGRARAGAGRSSPCLEASTAERCRQRARQGCRPHAGRRARQAVRRVRGQ